jgi:hypothetical protein
VPYPRSRQRSHRSACASRRTALVPPPASIRAASAVTDKRSGTPSAAVAARRSSCTADRRWRCAEARPGRLGGGPGRAPRRLVKTAILARPWRRRCASLRHRERSVAGIRWGSSGNQDEMGSGRRPGAFSIALGRQRHSSALPAQ